MSAANMLTRANLQPHLVNLIARLGRADVELAVGLLLDYIDAREASAARPGPIPFTRSANRNGWTTFNVRDEHADEAAARLAGDQPATDAHSLHLIAQAESIQLPWLESALALQGVASAGTGEEFGARLAENVNRLTFAIVGAARSGIQQSDDRAEAPT